MEVLAKRLKWLREKKRLGQKEVAAEIGMSLNGYQKIEYGDRDPKLDALVKLARLFSESTDFLLGLSDKSSKLKEIEMEVVAAKGSFINTRETAGYYNYIIQDLKKSIDQRKIEFQENPEDGENLNELRAEEKYLKVNEEDREKEYKKLYSKQKEYGDRMIEYIENLLEIPESNPLENSLLKSISPLTVQRDVENNGEYMALLYGKDIGAIGALFSKTKEELEYKLSRIMTEEDLLK